jgi:transcriptional regulator with XRE-family HTH domain
MIGHQPTEQRVGVFDVAQIASPVERVEAGAVQPRCISNVVQPRGCYEHVGVPAQNWGDSPRCRSDSLGVCPSARQRVREEAAGSGFGPVGVAHRPKLGAPCRTFTDAATPSWDVSGTSPSVCGRGADSAQTYPRTLLDSNRTDGWQLFIIVFGEVYNDIVPRQSEPFAPGVLWSRRVAAGKSLVALSQAVGVSARQIINYEQGKHSPSPAGLKRLAEVLGVTAQALAGVPQGEETLGDLRRFAGLDRAEAARLLAVNLPGVSVWRLQAVESGREVRAWRDPAVLKQVIAALAKTYGVSPGKVRLAWFRTFPAQADLLRPPQPKHRPGAGPQPVQARPGRAERTWNELNERQRAYLVACYRQDQEAEQEARAKSAAGQPTGAPVQWRKLPFTIKADPVFTGYTPIQERLREESHHDAGAGATLHALTRRGLLQVSEDQVEVFPLGPVARVLVELTRLGRACARAGLGEVTRSRPPAHLLSEWLWRNLVKVAMAGSAGLPEADLWGRSRFYLGTGFRPHGAMSRGYIDTIPVREETGQDSYVREYRWHLTEPGRQHMIQYGETYRALYSNVAIDGLNLG